MGLCPLIFVVNKDAVSLVAGFCGPYGAGNTEERTPMSETPVLMAWRRRDLEMPRLRSRRSQWVVATSPRRSDPSESEKPRTQQLAARPVSHRALDLQTRKSALGDLPMSSPSPATQTHKPAPGDLTMSSWSPPTHSHKRGRLPTALFIHRVRARYDRQSFGYGTGSLTACP